MAKSRFSRATERSFKKAAKKIKQFSAAHVAAANDGLRLIGEEVMTDVKASAPGHGVPVDEGILRSTGRVSRLNLATKSGLPEVELSFGGASAPYALAQHERTDYRHDVGEARYLVRGLERWKSSGSQAWQSIKRNAKAATQAVAAKGGGP